MNNLALFPSLLLQWQDMAMAVLNMGSWADAIKIFADLAGNGAGKDAITKAGLSTFTSAVAQAPTLAQESIAIINDMQQAMETAAKIPADIAPVTVAQSVMADIATSSAPPLAHVIVQDTMLPATQGLLDTGIADTTAAFAPGIQATAEQAKQSVLAIPVAVQQPLLQNTETVTGSLVSQDTGILAGVAQGAKGLLPPNISTVKDQAAVSTAGLGDNVTESINSPENLADTITGGGIRGVNVQVNSPFVENFNVNTQVVEQGYDHLKDTIKSIFLQVLNSGG